MNDIISRQAAIKAIDDLPNCYNGYSDTYDKACIIGVLEEVPTIEPVKHGKWETTMNSGELKWCSECGWVRHSHDDRTYRYCPYCGAKMDGEEQKGEIK